MKRTLTSAPAVALAFGWIHACVYAQASHMVSEADAQRDPQQIGFAVEVAMYDAAPSFNVVSIEAQWTTAASERMSLRATGGGGGVLRGESTERDMGAVVVHASLDALINLGGRSHSIRPYVAVGARAAWYSLPDHERVPYAVDGGPSPWRLLFGPTVGIGLAVNATESTGLTNEVTCGTDLVTTSPTGLFLSARIGLSWRI